VRAAVLECGNARAIPKILREIETNTRRKPRAKKEPQS
jgi:hypothetical protein